MKNNGKIKGRVQLYFSNTENQIIRSRKIYHSKVFISIAMKTNNFFKLLSVSKLIFYDHILLRRKIITVRWRKKNDWKKKHEHVFVQFSHFNHLKMKRFKSYSNIGEVKYDIFSRSSNTHFLTNKKPYLGHKSFYTAGG